MIEERANENREMTVILSYVKQRGASAFMRLTHITKENGSIYKSTRERVDSRWAPGSFDLIALVVLKNVSEKAFIKFGFNFRESVQN